MLDPGPVEKCPRHATLEMLQGAPNVSIDARWLAVHPLGAPRRGWASYVLRGKQDRRVRVKGAPELCTRFGLGCCDGDSDNGRVFRRIDPTKPDRNAVPFVFFVQHRRRCKAGHDRSSARHCLGEKVGAQAGVGGRAAFIAMHESSVQRDVMQFHALSMQ